MTTNETTYVPGQLTDSMLESAHRFTRDFFKRNQQIYLYPDGSFTDEDDGGGDSAHFYSELLAQVRSLVANDHLLIQEQDAYIDQAYEEVKNIAARQDGFKDATDRKELLDRAGYVPTEEDDEVFLVCQHNEDGRAYLSRSLCMFGPLIEPDFEPAIFAQWSDAQRMVDRLVGERDRAETEARRRVGPESNPYDDMPGTPITPLAQAMGWKRSYHRDINPRYTYRYHYDGIDMAFDNELTLAGIEALTIRIKEVKPIE